MERALASLMVRLDAAAPAPDAIPERSIVCIIPDLATAFRTELKDSRFNGLEEVDVDQDAEVTITARSDDLIALIEGRLNVGFAFLTGKIRVDASTQDLMTIRRLF